MNQAGHQKETDLVARARSGDRDAFDELVRGCALKMYNLAYKLVDNQQEAEDLAQNAFIKAFKGISRFEHTCRFSSWMYRITVNLWKNKVKYEKRRRILRIFSFDKPVETENNSIPVQPADPGSDPAIEAEKNQKVQSIQRVLRELDESSREIIVLRELEGLSYEEIADVSGCAMGTVKSRLTRARELLREKYLQYYKEEAHGL